MFFFLAIPLFAADPGATPTTVVGALTLGLIALAAGVRELWKDNKTLRDRLDTVREEIIETIQSLQRETLTVTLDSTRRQEESSKTVEAAMQVIQQAVASRPSGEQLDELSYLLRELKEQRLANRRAPSRSKTKES